MKKFYRGVVAVLLLMVGMLVSNSITVRAEDQAAAPAPAVEAVKPAEPVPAAMVEPAVEPEMEEIDEAKVLKDAAAKLKTMVGDADAQKLAKQLEELASDYEY